MRGILSLGLMCLAAGELVPQCTLDSSGFVADGIDSALDIWASSKRCHGQWLANAPVKCEQDITSSIKSVTAMANAIAHMASSCGIVKTAAPKCALAVDTLVSATAGLAAASGKVADKCFDINGAFDEHILERKTLLAKCTSSSGDSVNGLFAAFNTIQHAKAQCPSGEKNCAVDALSAISVLSNLGAHMASSVSHCGAYHKLENGQERELMMPATPPTTPTLVVSNPLKPIGCTEGVFAAIAELSKVATIGLTIEKACQGAVSSRLYQEKDSEAATTSPLMLALGAAVPIMAVLSFVAGLRVARSRQQAPARRFEADEEGLLEE